MKVFDGTSCRLGNALFRYLASSLFCIIYKATRTYNPDECNSIISEEFYKYWCDSILLSNTVFILCFDNKQLFIINSFSL